MDSKLIFLGGTDDGRSPVLPYVGRGYDGKAFTLLCGRFLAAALVRCGFDICGPTSGLCDAQDAAMAAVRSSADAAVLVSYAVYGSGRSFCRENGARVRYSQRIAVSRRLAEDICAKLGDYKNCSARSDGTFCSACPSVTVECGYLTDFDEARLIYDPDVAADIAEHIAIGICEFFAQPYIIPDDITAYPLLCAAATGKRGKKIKMLQSLLCANGYEQTADGIFGQSTDAAVKAFCADMGLRFDGITPAVWRALTLREPKDIPFGAKGADVYYLQRKLLSRLYKTELTGIADNSTVEAAKAFYSAPLDGFIPAELTKKLCASRGRPRLF